MSSTKKKRTSITSRRIMRVSRDIVDAYRLGDEGEGTRRWRNAEREFKVQRRFQVVSSEDD